MEQKIDVKISDVLAFFEKGKTREEIASHYGLTLAEAKKWIFNHEKLKNKKPHKSPKVVLIDDTTEIVNNQSIPAEENSSNGEEVPTTQAGTW